MGRGRAKAKQTKVARELKYSSQPTDLDALQRELGGPGHAPGSGSGSSSGELTEDDEYDDFDNDDWASASR